MTSIAQGGFYWCRNLESIVIPDSVTEIGTSAFASCYGLKSIQLSKNLDSISWSMFSNCTSLTSITIQKGVVTIDLDAFGGCSSLIDITIPVSVKEIKDSAFRECSALKNVKYMGSDEQWKRISIGDVQNEALTNADIYWKTTVKDENVSLPKTVVYNGKARKPAITVKVKGKKVSKSNYTAAWKNNKKSARHL